MPSTSGGALRRELGICRGRRRGPDRQPPTGRWPPRGGGGCTTSWSESSAGAPRLSVVLVGATPDGRLGPPEQALSRTGLPGREGARSRRRTSPSRTSTSTPIRPGRRRRRSRRLCSAFPSSRWPTSRRTDPVHIFQAGSPGLAGYPRSGRTPSKFAVAVRRLALDADLRLSEGAEVRAAVLAVHDGPAWRCRSWSPSTTRRDLCRPPTSTTWQSPRPTTGTAPCFSAPPPRPRAGTDPRRLMQPLGDLFDSTMRSDLLRRAAPRPRDLRLRVRVAPPWQEHDGRGPAACSSSCSTYPRLSVSLPFLPGDGLDGERTEAHLVALLDRSGLTPEDCGDISVDSVRPPTGRSGDGRATSRSPTRHWNGWSSCWRHRCWEAPGGVGPERSSAPQMPMVAAPA